MFAYRASPGTARYADLERSVRSGDMLLFDDPRLDALGPAEAVRRRRAAALVRALTVCPCAAYDALALDEQFDAELERYDTQRASQRPPLASEWLQWNHAALIVCMDVKRPGGGRGVVVDDGAESALTEPYVFVPAWSTGGDPARDTFVLKPLREFLASGVRGARYALRHLLLVDEGTGGTDNRRMMSQRRANLRNRIVDFQRRVFEAATKRPDPQRMDRCVVRALTTTESFDVERVRADAARAERDVLLLMRASSAYLVLQTLFSAQVTRIEPRVIDAARLVQSHDALQEHLAAAYQFSDARIFTYE